MINNLKAGNSLQALQSIQLYQTSPATASTHLSLNNIDKVSNLLISPLMTPNLTESQLIPGISNELGLNSSINLPEKENGIIHYSQKECSEKSDQQQQQNFEKKNPLIEKDLININNDSNANNLTGASTSNNINTNNKNSINAINTSDVNSNENISNSETSSLENSSNMVLDIGTSSSKTMQVNSYSSERNFNKKINQNEIGLAKNNFHFHQILQQPQPQQLMMFQHKLTPSPSTNQFELQLQPQIYNQQFYALNEPTLQPQQPKVFQYDYSTQQAFSQDLKSNNNFVIKNSREIKRSQIFYKPY